MHRPDGSELKIAEHHFAEIEIHKEKRQKGDFFIVQKRLNASTLRIRREKSKKVENGIRENGTDLLLIGQKVIKSPGPFTFESDEIK